MLFLIRCKTNQGKSSKMRTHNRTSSEFQ